MLDVQVDSDSPGSEIIDSQYAANNVSAHAIENQNLPDGIAIFIQNGCGLRDEATMS